MGEREERPWQVQHLREEIDAAKIELEKARRDNDWGKAAELANGKLPELTRQLEAEEKASEAKKESSLLRDRVTEEEIANIVARWTGIPVSKLVEGEREKLLRLPDTLHQRVIGQDEAVQKVSDAILRSRAGIANPNRPSAASCSSAPRASARPSWPRRWRRPCLTTRRTWSVST